MARLTVEDCLQHVDNRFELILQASKRAREIIRGGDPLVPWDNDQATVVALREIADGLHLEDNVNVKNKAAAPAIMAVEGEEETQTLEASSAESDENNVADSASATAEQTIGDGEDHPNKAEGDASEEEKGEEE